MVTAGMVMAGRTADTERDSERLEDRPQCCQLEVQREMVITAPLLCLLPQLLGAGAGGAVSNYASSQPISLPPLSHAPLVLLTKHFPGWREGGQEEGRPWKQRVVFCG
jgi:hypothetical protein